MLTQYKPELKCVGKTDVEDLYIKPGDGVGYRHMCNWSVERIFNTELKSLESIRVYVYGKRL